MIKQIGNINNLPVELNNPFNSNYITNINITTYKSAWTPNWVTYGTVEFKRENTTGNQKFEGTDLVDVLKKIYTFVNNLE